jgi:flagellar assembly factor FliW
VSAVPTENAATTARPDDAVVLTFLDPPPGLAPLDRFALAPLDEAGLLFTLRAVEAPGTRLFLIDPEPFFPEYHPTISEEILRCLDVADAPVTVLAVLRPGAEGEPHTVNLLAPVVINATTGVAVQTVLDGDDWPLRAPLSVG